MNVLNDRSADRVSDLVSAVAAVPQDVGPLALYHARVADGLLRSDPDQERVAARLDRLWTELKTYHPPPVPPEPEKEKKGFLASVMRRLPAVLHREKEGPPPPRGVYIVGRVGRGKTMLMDLFFSCAPLKKKQRIHFLSFMQEVHQRLRRLKLENPGMSDPIPPLARTIAADATLLCFDEFQINDIADAMILGRLFDALFQEHVIIVATSNTVPGDLFQNRPGADAFRPFIAVIHRNLDTETLDSETDYRRGREQDDTTWIVPADETARHRLDKVVARYGDGHEPEEVTLEFSGRTLPVDHAQGPVARFDFTSLCSRPLGPGDYLAVAKRFPVIVVDDIPALGPDDANVARRFITLIDALYDNGNLLFVSADATPDQLFPEGEGADAFARTASRLAEMSSESWLARAHAPGGCLSRP
ncbi:cell division protein ZapE [Acetobacter oeni]|uniref:Cell division protein ZapE n=1 Tax=Acetobacter oeni TaxID=304077 RepID=A0A511XLR8_9PROT|nr:cell division protein ZapE [Acetobacter oeni]MBB3881850.1 cell division protein ZapE [Acetobacter oeni]NHO17823.1 cell division protein ZapE [Acetobacter oeni]GBR05335.1 AFG1 family ATPase [Acetobacter oeni LMG 21952]GEN63893.1 cell division protein ZapE [Acetobacter oeni]